MMRLTFAARITLLVAIVAALAGPAAAASEATLAELIAAAAQHVGVDADLLASIVWVESRGWPWAINVNGAGYYPRSRAQAIEVLEHVGANVDIGYGQVNFQTWGPTLGLRKADLLDPWTNLVVSARILRMGMESEPGTWRGVARYHSATPERQWRYLVHAGLLETFTRLRRLRQQQPQEARTGGAGSVHAAP